MAVTYPFDFPEKNGKPSKISKDEEVEIWQNIQDTINDLVGRCNAANSSSIITISLIHQDSKPGALTAAEYDLNIATIETALNQIIIWSDPQGLNYGNRVSLIKREDYVFPLLIWQRDSNFRTIQTAMNAINSMYVWAGV